MWEAVYKALTSFSFVATLFITSTISSTIVVTNKISTVFVRVPLATVSLSFPDTSAALLAVILNYK